MKTRYLVLEDGSMFKGFAFGGDQNKVGELIFQTGMSGYQEILSDLSFYGQIVTMTYPNIGICGINRDDFESMSPQIFGLVVKEYCDRPSNWRSDMNIDEFMKLKNIPGIYGVDTREITRKIRDQGVMKAIFCDEEKKLDHAIKKVHETALPRDGVSKVSTQKAFPIPSRGQKVVMIDIGTKFAVIREFNLRGCDLIVVPYDMSAEEILTLHPDGVILSGGPGEPQSIPETINTTKKLLGKIPLMGIGLGHEVIAVAVGAKIIKMKVGHHENSSPIKNLKQQKIEFTAQNHGYEIDPTSIIDRSIIVTYKALQDDSIEGFTHKEYPILSFAFEPEAAPGADDLSYVFDEFCEMMKQRSEA